VSRPTSSPDHQELGNLTAVELGLLERPSSSLALADRLINTSVRAAWQFHTSFRLTVSKSVATPRKTTYGSDMKKQSVAIQISEVNESDLLVQMRDQEERDLFLNALHRWMRSWEFAQQARPEE
jgi:hypothetical protein